MINELVTPILNDDLKSIYFFNGRLLSAQDMQQEQSANRAANALLGRALGDGVAYGLDVRPSPSSTRNKPVITITDGLAVNRLGQTLELSQGTQGTDLALVRPSQNGSAVAGGLFADCKEKLPGDYVVGKGVYLLTIRPATGKRERAPVSGLGNVEVSCNARYEIQGVQFRLIQLKIDASVLNDAAHLRNRVAHLCFGTGAAQVSEFVRNPFGPVVTGYGLLDDLLRPECLTDDEVPLAVIYWTAGEGVAFVDRWAVRRRITHPTADTAWPLLVSDRHAAEAEAVFLQFQDQIKGIRDDPKENMAAIVATDRFIYLPPVGLLPITGQNSPGGFNWQTFFGDLAPQALDMTDAAMLPHLIRESLTHAPCAVNDKSSGKLTLYLVRENVDTVESGASQLVVVFAKHAVAYGGVARFGYATWNVSRFT